MNLYPILLIILIILLILSAILIATSSFLLSYNDKKINNNNLIKGGNKLPEIITQDNNWGLEGANIFDIIDAISRNVDYSQEEDMIYIKNHLLIPDASYEDLDDTYFACNPIGSIWKLKDIGSSSDYDKHKYIAILYMLYRNDPSTIAPDYVGNGKSIIFSILKNKDHFSLFLIHQLKNMDQRDINVIIRRGFSYDDESAKICKIRGNETNFFKLNIIEFIKNIADSLLKFSQYQDFLRLLNKSDIRGILLLLNHYITEDTKSTMISSSSSSNMLGYSSLFDKSLDNDNDLLLSSLDNDNDSLSSLDDNKSLKGRRNISPVKEIKLGEEKQQRRAIEEQEQRRAIEEQEQEQRRAIEEQRGEEKQGEEKREGEERRVIEEEQQQRRAIGEEEQQRRAIGEEEQRQRAIEQEQQFIFEQAHRSLISIIDRIYSAVRSKPNLYALKDIKTRLESIMAQLNKDEHAVNNIKDIIVKYCNKLDHNIAEGVRDLASDDTIIDIADMIISYIDEKINNIDEKIKNIEDKKSTIILQEEKESKKIDDEEFNNALFEGNDGYVSNDKIRERYNNFMGQYNKNPMRSEKSEKSETKLKKFIPIKYNKSSELGELSERKGSQIRNKFNFKAKKEEKMQEKNRLKNNSHYAYLSSDILDDRSESTSWFPRSENKSWFPRNRANSFNN